MAFPTIDLQMGDRFRCSVSKAWNDCKQYVTFFATFDLVLVGLNSKKLRLLIGIIIMRNNNYKVMRKIGFYFI